MTHAMSIKVLIALQHSENLLCDAMIVIPISLQQPHRVDPTFDCISYTCQLA